MALSGKLNTTVWKSNGNRTRYLELSWERTAFSVVEQTSTIKWTLTGKGNYEGYVMSAPFTVVIDGETVYNSKERIKLYQEQVVATGTKTIKHNTDGTKTFSASVKAGIYWSYVNVSGSGSFTLDLVGMASITAAPNFNDEESPTITYYNPVGNAITSLQAAISLTGESVDIPYRSIEILGNSYTFNLTQAERDILRAATVGSNSRKVRFYLRNVVEGKIYFSWKEVNFTVINAQPTIEASITDINDITAALTGDRNTLIRYHSKVSATMSATAYKKATIAANRIEYNGNFITADVGLYSNVESNVFSFITTDSRNNTATETIVAPMIDYVKPTANIDNTQQMDTTGYYGLKCSGNYYNDTFGYTDAAQPNTLTVNFRYKEQGGDYNSWERMGHSLDGNTYSASAFVNGLDYRKTYVFQCQVIDKLNTIVSAEITVNALPVFHWSDSDFVFEVPVIFNAGTSGTTGGVESSGNGATAGTWIPTLTNSNAVSSYTTQSGWYQKIGDVITIGWQIKATIKSGFSGSTISIGGLPYTPTYAAFGGGVAHNVYLTAGFCFEGWCAGTDGLITMRGQPCNNTAAANLQINSSAYYPTGTSNTVITLAGTICYYGGAASVG